MEPVQLLLTFLLLAPAAAECPQVSDFMSATPTVATVRVRVTTATAPDTVWARVDAKLREWCKTTFVSDGPKSTQFVPSRVGLMVAEMPMLQQAESTKRLEARSTCYVQMRRKGVDSRLAFLFVLEPIKKGRPPVMEVRWLGQSKGRGERTWHADAENAAAFAQDLIRRIGSN